MRASPFPSPKNLMLVGVLTLIVLLVYGVLRWMGVPVGNWLDWVVGIVGFWWLLGITTIPWGLYFGAREVIDEIKESRAREIGAFQKEERTARRIASRCLAAALMLHLVSTAGFVGLGYWEITSLGWYGAVAALALTFVQPVARLYSHLQDLLASIHRQVRYPREDIRAVEDRLTVIEEGIKALRLDCRQSWASTVEERIHTLRAEQSAVVQSLESYREDAQGMAKRLSEDTKFLGNVRDLLRFIKEA